MVDQSSGRGTNSSRAIDTVDESRGISQRWCGGDKAILGLKQSHYLVDNHQGHDRLHTVQLFVTNERRNFCDVPKHVSVRTKKVYKGIVKKTKDRNSDTPRPPTT